MKDARRCEVDESLNVVRECKAMAEEGLVVRPEPGAGACQEYQPGRFGKKAKKRREA